MLGGSSGIGLAAARLALEAGALRAFFREAGASDHVFATAGAPHYAPLADLDLEAASRAVGERTAMMLSIARRAADHVDQRGSVTFMGGTGTRTPSPGLTVTGAALAAAEALVRGLALELAPIRVNLLAAGFVDTRCPPGCSEPRYARSRSSRRMIFPDADFGISSTISTARMRL